MSDVVSKLEFARMIGRAPSAVSGYIATGKLSGDALEGTGHRAKIRVPEALEQLRMTLDVGQQLAQARPVHVTATQAGAAASAAPSPPANDDAARLMRARAEREELALRAERAAEAEREGRWMLVSVAREVWTAEMTGLVHAFETWLTTSAASDVARLDSRDPRAIARCLQEGFRGLQARLAASEDA